jgi:hypothetical protein
MAATDRLEEFSKVFGHSGKPAIVQGFAAVAQLDRVLGYEPRGRGFESCQPHQQSLNEFNASRVSPVRRFSFLGDFLADFSRRSPAAHPLTIRRSVAPS